MSTRLGLVGRGRLGLAHPLGLDADHPAAREVAGRRGGTPLGERLVVRLSPDSIGVPDDQQVRVVVLVEAAGQGVKIRARSTTDHVRIEVEHGARIEDDRDPLADPLDGGAGDVLLELLRLLVHLVSDDRVGGAADHGADDRALFLLVQRSATDRAKQHQQRERGVDRLESSVHGPGDLRWSDHEASLRRQPGTAALPRGASDHRS